jgi:hypothetical protein
VHPTAGERNGRSYRSPRRHSIAWMCDDLDSTVTELAGRGADFTGQAEEMGFGRGIAPHVAGADVDQPHHRTANDLRLRLTLPPQIPLRTDPPN